MSKFGTLITNIGLEINTKDLYFVVWCLHMIKQDLLACVTKCKNDYSWISWGNKSPSVAKLSLAFPYLFYFPDAAFINLLHLNDLLKKIAFLYRPIRGRKICYTAGSQAGSHIQNGLYSAVALADKVTSNPQSMLHFPSYKLHLIVSYKLHEYLKP